MVKNGLNGPQATPEEIATLTVTALKRTVPPAIPGIFFLSGEMPLDCDNEEVSSIFKNCDGDFEVINQALTSFTSTPIMKSATINLNKMHELYPTLPWHVSFSYGKALQKVR